MTIVTIEERIMMINGVKNPRFSLWLWLAEAKRKKYLRDQKLRASLLH